MGLKQYAKKSSLGRYPRLPNAIGEHRELLSALFRSSTVGIALFDRQFRFRAINDALASMNGVPAKAHFGKTLQAILGRASPVVQSAIQQVFSTGEPVTDYEITATLPARSDTGRWIASYFPIKDSSGEVHRAGAMVLELTKHEEIQAALSRLHQKLTSVASGLRDNLGAPRPSGLGGDCADRASFLTRSVVLLENCLAETRAISELLHDPLPLASAGPMAAHPEPDLLGQRNFAALRSIEHESECLSPLSAREREVIALLATGKTNKEIARILVISTRTVESHRARIMLKLDLHSVSDLVRYAVRSDIIQL
jgi:PAS domain S-box-containing protein